MRHSNVVRVQTYITLICFTVVKLVMELPRVPKFDKSEADEHDVLYMYAFWCDIYIYPPSVSTDPLFISFDLLKYFDLSLQCEDVRSL